MADGLNKLTEGVGKVIETVPDLYEDALKPIAQESGKTLALIPRTINAALVPLRQWIAEREYKLAETEKLLAQKLKNVNPEKIVTPESYVAVPVIQAISYSMNNEELRNLYANLLSKAMHKDYNYQVHPAFIEIIKQLSPLDIKIFHWFYDRVGDNIVLPCCNLVNYSIRYQGRKPYKTYKSYSTYETNIIGQDFASHDAQSQSIDNLIRLRLIEVSQDVSSNTKAYKTIQTSTEYTDTLLRHPGISTLAPQYFCLKSTELGNLFFKICACPISK